MMKNNSTYAAANGTIPAHAMATLGFKSGGGVGIALEMVLVTVGKLIVSALQPKYAPKKTRGIETQHHIATTISTSKNGTDPEEWKNAKMILKKMNIPKHKPGKVVAVDNVQVCHCRPLIALYNLDDKYPANTPQRMYNTKTPVIKLPRREGFKNPTALNIIVKNPLAQSCSPVPQNTQYIIGQD